MSCGFSVDFINIFSSYSTSISTLLVQFPDVAFGNSREFYAMASASLTMDAFTTGGDPLFQSFTVVNPFSVTNASFTLPVFIPSQDPPQSMTNITMNMQIAYATTVTNICDPTDNNKDLPAKVISDEPIPIPPEPEEGAVVLPLAVTVILILVAVMYVFGRKRIY